MFPTPTPHDPLSRPGRVSRDIGMPSLPSVEGRMKTAYIAGRNGWTHSVSVAPARDEHVLLTVRGR